MNKVLSVLIFILCGVSVSAQQDAQFSQYMFNGIYVNPAYAGYREQWNIHAFYRNQWTNYPGAPKTFSIAAEGTANNDRVGLGLQVMNDKLGASNTTSMYATYAYRIPVNEDGSSRLALGISAGFMQQRLDISLLTTSSSISDPALTNGENNRTLPDARFGIFYNRERFFAGISASNLLTQAFQKSSALKEYLPLKPHLYFTMGGLIPLSEELLLKPGLLIKEDLAGPTSVDLNAFILISQKLWLGGSYRSTYLHKSNLETDLKKPAALAFMAEIFVNEKLRLGYAYDMTLNSTVATKYPTHELSIGYFFQRRNARMMSPRYF
ncbi:PorP/SprF family type IX secretion system membrane protein [Chitinophaga nivalis]|uniref:Type IX secretion system membrane protein PorP/SprF n=1 Tax=Chitinophaga nivalis TaxID=2991709 RepID=A0ABT3IJQ1_9BACT|nr:type IX secretion system membrane protein PorP/SprF [Chitinophaga nivalis]MCW3466163.1 type IX secretion system membrane protein PorP/SprF [Chitinophaga nivalis]MCW3484146.1 type IX secretion system membrane protein PorP/SprF [Chitinophaga nivalis]